MKKFFFNKKSKSIISKAIFVAFFLASSFSFGLCSAEEGAAAIWGEDCFWCKNIANICPISPPTDDPGGPPGTGGGNLADENAMSECQVCAFLNSVGSPWASSCGCLLTAAQEYNINPAAMLAIFGQESTYGKAPGYMLENNNPGNVKLTADGLGIVSHDWQGHSMFDTVCNGWRGMAHSLRGTWLDCGASSFEEIGAGSCPTCYCGAYAEDPNWANNLNTFMQEALGTSC